MAFSSNAEPALEPEHFPANARGVSHEFHDHVDGIEHDSGRAAR